MILAVRTDAPTVFFELFDDSGREIGDKEWLAERQLARDLLARLEEFLGEHGGNWETLSGLVVYRGPGSFTGLRIGMTVMNSIAYGASLPIVGETGDTWSSDGVARLTRGENDHMVMPEYGAPARITSPRK